MRDEYLQKMIRNVMDGENEADRQTQLMATVLDSSYDGIYITDGEATTVWMNTSYERITGLREKDVLGYNMRTLVEKGVISKSASLLALERNMPVTIEQTFRTGKHAVVTSTPFYDKKNRVRMIVTNVRDISDIYQMQQELEKRYQKNLRYREEIDVIRQYLISHTDLIANDPEMLNLLRTVKRAAQMDTMILLQGETGVGKERVAMYIHQNSLRKNKNFIKVNCGTIPEDLAESELFGYERGAFTGARKEGKMGLFEVADKGTIFLDEIGDLPPVTQTKLLRVLQEQEFLRVGGNVPVKVDVRVLAATNRDLKAMVRNKTFREDLYYRLSVFPVLIPPLRCRKGDIGALAESMLKKLNQKYNTDKRLSNAALAGMMEYNWPGNVRELKNVLERAYIMCNNHEILMEDLGIAGIAPTAFGPTGELTERMNLKTELEKTELEYMERAYQVHKNVREAARYLSMDPATFSRRRKHFLEKYGSPKDQ